MKDFKLGSDQYSSMQTRVQWGTHDIVDYAVKQHGHVVLHESGQHAPVIVGSHLGWMDASTRDATHHSKAAEGVSPVKLAPRFLGIGAGYAHLAPASNPATRNLWQSRGGSAFISTSAASCVDFDIRPQPFCLWSRIGPGS